VSQALTWFSALAYAVLLTGGGADGRNWSPLVSRNGVIEPQLVKTGAGEVGRGGAIVTRLGACGRGGGVAAEPSAARSPMSNWRQSFNADQRRRADHNVGLPLRAETLLDAELISRYGVPPLDTAERPWTVPLPDFNNRPLAAGALAPLPTGRVNKAQLLFVLVDVNDIETSDPPRRPAVCRHLRGPGRKALAALVLSGVALVIFGRLTQLTVTTLRNVIGGMDLEARSPPASRSTPNCAGSWTRPPGSGASGSTGSN
jgi:hypothetical protein